MRTLTTLLVSMAFAAVTAPASAQHPGGHTAKDEARQFATGMGAGMKRMMEDMHRPGYSGDPDIDFLTMMIPHHEGAVEMARLALIYGRDPLTRKLAEEIIASQQAEITAMRARLEILRRGADPDPGGFPALHGTRGIAEKR
jgi:uncharacterized protein (DUF305 family)